MNQPQSGAESSATASAQGVHYCSFDKSGETGPGLHQLLSRSPASLAPCVLGPTPSLPPGWPGSQGSGNVAARVHVPRHGCQQAPMVLECKEGVCVCTGECVCCVLWYMLFTCCSQVHSAENLCFHPFKDRRRGHFLVLSHKWNSASLSSQGLCQGAQSPAPGPGPVGAGDVPTHRLGWSLPPDTRALLWMGEVMQKSRKASRESRG